MYRKRTISVRLQIKVDHQSIPYNSLLLLTETQREIMLASGRQGSADFSIYLIKKNTFVKVLEKVLEYGQSKKQTQLPVYIPLTFYPSVGYLRFGGE